MAAPDDEIEIRRVRVDEVDVFRAFRLRALADAPDAFGQPLAEAEALPPSAWVERVTQSATSDDSVLMVAADTATGSWLGMTGGVVVAGKPDSPLIVSVWVAPEARRRGAARRLLEAT